LGLSKESIDLTNFSQVLTKHIKSFQLANLK
jgi:hypothetical protein